MNSKIKTLIMAVVFVLFLVGAYYGYQLLAQINQPASNLETLAKTAAPDFTVFDAQGNAVKLSDFAGSPIVLNFWASWCPPCRSEMPHFNEIYAGVQGDVIFMMVDLVDGQQETQADGQQYIVDQGFTFPVFFDNQQLAANAYGITSIPTTFFIDAKGDIITAYNGSISADTLTAAIDLIR